MNTYKANTGNCLLNLDDFTWGNTVLSNNDLNLIEVSQNDGKELHEKYQSLKENTKDIDSIKTQLKQDILNKGYSLNIVKTI